MQINKAQVMAALGHVIDPDLRKDLVTLNMIEDLHIEGEAIRFKVVLTTPACPLKDAIEADIKTKIAEMVSPSALVEVIFDSRVTSHRKDKKDMLPGVKNIICVASGKGGVGKSTVSVNLALALAANGSKVGLLDADIYGPSIPMMLGIRGKRPGVQQIDGKHYILPLEVHGIKVLSIGLLIDEKQAVVWRGPMVSSALKQFVTDCIWGELDYLILDMPPGTGDIHLTMIQTIPITGAVIVTTPQDVALADAKKAVAMFKLDMINVPILGIVENMSYFTPAELPNNKYYIFGKNGGKRLADEFDLPFLGEIPLVQSVREGGDDGKPVVTSDDYLTKEAFINLGVTTERQVAVYNATLNEPVLQP
ncbi:MAG: Mrp/NBP35 family ATP-binding protein [Chitinophagales bacterium]|nr:Mrp/NBP35 family ATP-binding protein [Chitinophagales bacterium]